MGEETSPVFGPSVGTAMKKRVEGNRLDSSLGQPKWKCRLGLRLVNSGERTDHEIKLERQ